MGAARSRGERLAVGPGPGRARVLRGLREFRHVGSDRPLPAADDSWRLFHAWGVVPCAVPARPDQAVANAQRRPWLSLREEPVTDAGRKRPRSRPSAVVLARTLVRRAHCRRCAVRSGATLPASVTGENGPLYEQDHRAAWPRTPVPEPPPDAVPLLAAALAHSGASAAASVFLPGIARSGVASRERCANDRKHESITAPQHDAPVRTGPLM